MNVCTLMWLFMEKLFFFFLFMDVLLMWGFMEKSLFFLHECTLKWPYTEKKKKKKLFSSSGMYCTLMWSFQEKLFFFFFHGCKCLMNGVHQFPTRVEMPNIH